MRFYPIFFGVMMLAFVPATFGDVASAQTREPGGTPEAAMLALSNPHEFAWQLFLYVNRQARSGAVGEVDETKTSIAQFDPDRPVIWETWALASGLDIDFGANPPTIAANKSEVFKNPATQPVAWDALDRGPGSVKTLSAPFKSSPLVVSGINRLLPRNQIGPLIAPPGTDPRSDETRMNRSTYETVRSKNLYSVEGLEAAAAKAKAENSRILVNFDAASKEVKARWIRLRQCDSNPDCSEKKRYHWRTVQTSAGATQIYGLISLHIITKDLSNWFWSDFSHIDCEKPQGECAHPTVEGKPAETPLDDPTTKATSGQRPETKNTKWENYRLRGIQIDFVTSTGAATILSNPVIEATFQTSSCMTCHSNASVGIRQLASAVGTSLPLFAGLKGVLNSESQQGDIGQPNCQRFVNRAREPFAVSCPGVFDDQSKTIYFQTDFLWSLPFRAFSTSAQ
jgi:hypothetical protein